MSTLIPAVGYARRSTTKQEKSIPEQITAVEAHAADKGYKLLRWYIDDGISGDDTANRPEFRRMVAEAEGQRDFKAILCWDRARFGRFDSIENGYYAHRLRLVGVHLNTVMEGASDWYNQTQRTMDGIIQEGKHQQLRDHAGNVARGQLGAMKAGSWVGSPPYGYNVVGPKHDKRLVLGDSAHRKIVQRIFREFVDDGRTMTEIATRLNAEGYPSPGGRPKGWRYDAVKVILENPAYTGDYAAGKGSYGKYHTIADGKVAEAVRRPGGKRAKHRKPEAEWIIVRDRHDSIVDRRLFDGAQTILAQGKTGRSRAATPYLLSGVLRCGLCGCVMHGLAGGSGRFRYYECAARAIAKKNKRHGMAVPVCCPGTTVREDAVLRSVSTYLHREFLPDGDDLLFRAERGALKLADLPCAYAAVKRLIAPPKLPAADRKSLQQRVTTLTQQIDKAAGNLVLLDPENIPAAQAKVKAMKEERAGLQAELNKRPPSEADVNAEVMEVIGALGWLAYLFGLAAEECGRDPAEVAAEWRELDPGENYQNGAANHPMFKQYLRKLAGINVWTRIDGRGTRTRHAFLRGEISLKVVGVKAGNLNPHLPGKSRKCCR